MFAFQGKAFFVDLLLGIMYCDLPTAATATGASVVEYHFIPLPHANPVDLKWDKAKPEDMGALYPDRTMRCVGGAIKLVCIDRTPPRRYGDSELTVWSLDPDLSKKHWQKERGFPVRDIRRLQSFSDPHSLPFTEPKCPVLMRDGTLCLLLPNKRRRIEDSLDDFICNIDLNSMSILWSGRIRGYRYDEPAMLPSDFLQEALSSRSTQEPVVQHLY
ncbi:hypothetical protein BAE44_0023583 [Dichanthelium oligosanthes]|uniref:DUF1618 domain-containing protein n=1 Tax=Dichanthelium oligosanthes TaxID=888268 RepID=A0A1E5UR93_9POAL|nr:hypothetical protein BAE44_0023583 [Dichanthelium oligosanthes]